MTKQGISHAGQARFDMADLAAANRAVGAACRYCMRPRPAGYSVTCGRSECQEAAYNDKEKRTPRRAK